MDICVVPNGEEDKGGGRGGEEPRISSASLSLFSFSSSPCFLSLSVPLWEELLDGKQKEKRGGKGSHTL